MNQDTMSLDDYFRNWEFSLFKTPPGFDVIHIRRMVFEEKYSEHGNYGAATVLLQNGDLDEAWNCINIALKIDPNSVHAWCNKGVYYLKSSPPQENEARLARDKMEEFLQQEEARKTAAIEYAYWQYHTIRTAQAKEEALKLFDRLLSNESTEPVIKHHYLYMKVEFQRSVLRKVFQQALVLLKTNSPDYEVAVWHNLAFLLTEKSCCDLIRHGFDEERFAIDVHRISEIDRMFCVDKIINILKQHPTLMDPRNQLFATIAKAYHKKARETDNYIERWELLEKALEYGEKYLEAKDKSPCFGSQVSSDILLQMWAMKYSEAEPEKAWSAYREIFGNQGGSKLTLWRFLSYEFHSMEVDSDPGRRALLEKAELHLENYRRENPCMFLSRFVTVKLLLGYPTEKIEAVFPKLDELERNEQRAAMLTTYGRFCEINNSIKKLFRNINRCHLMTRRK
ncbi:hypothetical protein EB796_022943 [Bugula neritina]|uniref:Uncharacterized protein n=1 Tax=Bugula neritina TaxID=10212 RepID=A0A7J7IZB9_BUGNE|nr:hypothetical protein EB796_022943 [Bugula neritina]